MNTHHISTQVTGLSKSHGLNEVIRIGIIITSAQRNKDKMDTTELTGDKL